MKKVFYQFVKLILISTILISSMICLYVTNFSPSFDLVEFIQTLKNKNRHDEARDLITVFDGQLHGDPKIENIRKDLNQHPFEKLKSLILDGVIKGNVHDTYSGIGAISADLCIVGDLRDFGIQSFKYITNKKEFDKLVFTLSAAGIGLSATAFVNGTNALAKNTIKYINTKKIPGLGNELLHRFLAGKIPGNSLEKIWVLFKKTPGPSRAPYHVFQISRI